MSKSWNVRLKTRINSQLPEGLCITVSTQQNNHNYPDLIKTLSNAGYNVRNVDGIWSDSFWEWSER